MMLYKRILYFGAIIAGLSLLMVSCKDGSDGGSSEGADITLKVQNTGSEVFYLDDVNGSSAFVKDTARLNGNSAHLSADVLPGIYRIRAHSDPRAQMPLLYLDNDTKVKLNIDWPSLPDYSISGSPENELLRKTMLMQNDLRLKTTELSGRINSTPDPAVRDSLTQAFARLLEEGTRQIKASIEESKSYNPNLTAFFLNLINPQTNSTYILGELQQLKEKAPDSRLIAQMLPRFQPQKPSGGLSIGTEVPDIVQSDPYGNAISLSSLRGKYVLIDFWASWCKPCRFENPNVVQTYKKYKDKGFDVFSVSLDKSRDRWLKAIEDDHLIWESHVSDLKGWANAAAQLYGVSSIPATFLIDPEGKVIARNLRGPALENKLKEVLSGS